MISRRKLVAAGVAVAATARMGVARAQPAMPAPGKRAWAAQLPVVRMGLLGGENDADRLARVDGYKKLLETTFEVPIKLLVAADYAGVIQAFAAKQLEVAYMSPAAYAGAWIQSQGDVRPLVVTQEQDGSTSYVSVMYTRADSGITSLADMKGHSLAWADPNSASGYLLPRAEFRAMGIDPESGKYFSRTGFAGGHEQGVVAVLNKQYDAGMTWTSGVGDAADGYSRGALRMMVDKKMLDMDQLRIIWKSRPILNGPLTVRKDTPEAFQEDMLAFHLALPTAHPDIYHAVDMGAGKGWVPVQHADYQPFIDMLQQEAAQRRRR
ncbi:MAG: phosphonate ABC transporter substrate-binding protein [Rhodospirillales bacterium 69-11]|nr:phosphate/phosphite/phosphonate ABC transporter substrate-binding protein [Rhodospirillales bacterium]OJW23119.1 MAG: phosphonate ABC transporter substrate-binding protein [Rhodospirillales bacterium 69-11]